MFSVYGLFWKTQFLSFVSVLLYQRFYLILLKYHNCHIICSLFFGKRIKQRNLRNKLYPYNCFIRNCVVKYRHAIVAGCCKHIPVRLYNCHASYLLWRARFERLKLMKASLPPKSQKMYRNFTWAPLTINILYFRRSHHSFLFHAHSFFLYIHSAA
jgi:hypothetical protein